MLEAAGKRVHVYTSPHLVRFNERFRLGAPGGGRLVARRGAGRRAGRMRARQWRRADHRVRDHHRRRPAAVFAPSGRRAAAGGRARRPARRHQRHRAAARHRHHADLASITPIFSATRWTRSPPRRPASSSAACRRSSPRSTRDALAVIERQAATARRAAQDRRRGLDRDRRARPAGLSGRSRPARSAGAEALRPPSVRECRAGHRRAARHRALERSRRPPSRPASSRPNGRRGCSGSRRARWSSWRRPAASSGSTAATIPTAAARSPPRSPISRSACRGRWC